MYNKGPKTFPIGTGGGVRNRLVKLAGGAVVLNTATAADDPIGAIAGMDGDGAEGDFAAVQFLKDDGTQELEAAGAADAGADAYAADQGRVQALPSAAGDYRKIGKFLQAASGAGSAVEVLPYNWHHVETVT